MKKFLLYLALLFVAAPLVSNGQFIPSQSALATKRNALTIVSIQDATPQTVAYNTAFGSLTLPSTRNVTLSNGQIVSATVTWDNTTYSATSPGEQTVFGDLTVPNWFTNPLLSRALAVVAVQEQITNLTYTTEGFQTFEIPDGVDTISFASAWGAGGSGGSLFNVGSASGAGGGAFSETVDFPVTAGEVAVIYVAPTTGSVLPTSADLDGTDGKHTQFGPTAPAGSTILSGSGAPGGGTGSDGNYYFDTDSQLFYGPKASGTWPSPSGTPYVKAAGGKKGIISGAGGLGGATADCIGDTKRAGGNGSTNAASRSGGGGGGADSGTGGGNATIISGTSVAGGIAGTPASGRTQVSVAGANGSSGTAISVSGISGGGGGARNTAGSTVRRGGNGGPGRLDLTYSGATTPPPDPGDAYEVAVWGQSNVLSPGNGSPGAPYIGALNTQIWITSTSQFDPLEYGVNNNFGGTSTGLGPELSIATTIAALAPNETYISKKGQSGTSMYTNWNVANNSTGRAAVSQLVASTDYLLDQQKDLKEIIVVFRQGEADIGASNPNAPSNVEAEYKDKLQDLIAYTIDRLESETIVDLTVTQFYWITVLVDNTSGTYTSDVVSAQIDGTTNFATDRPSYATKYAGGFTTSTIGYATIDGIHFNTASEIQIGLDCGALMPITP
jgi:hypothetical protein